MGKTKQFNNGIEYLYRDVVGEYNFAFVSFLADGSIFSFNNAFLSITSLTEKTAYEKNIKDLFPISKAEIESISPDNTIVKLFDQNQSHYHLYFGSMYQDSNQLNTNFLFITDRTQLRQYNSDLYSVFNQIKKLINHFQIGFTILNDEYRVIEANDVFCENLGYKKEEILKLTAYDYIYNFNNRKKDAVYDENQIHFFGKDNYHKRKDGTIIPIKGYGALTKINHQNVSICLYENLYEQKKSSVRLEQSETMLRNFISNSTEVILVLDTDLNIIYLSENTKHVFNFKKSIPKKEIANRYLPLKNKEFRQYIQRNFAIKNSKNEFEYTIKRNSKIRYYSVRTSTVNVDKKMIICYVRDVTKDKNYIEKLKQLSYHDQLTSLHNRQFMEMQLLELRKKENYPISIISSDVDGLKEVNDTLGHQAGDQLLILFSNILSNTHKNENEVFRIGGDEFIIIATNTDASQAAKIVKLIDQQIAEHNSSPSSLIKISASIGTSTTKQSNFSLSSMLALADKEMYKNKWQKKSNKE